MIQLHLNYQFRNVLSTAHFLVWPWIIWTEMAMGTEHASLHLNAVANGERSNLGRCHLWIGIESRTWFAGPQKINLKLRVSIKPREGRNNERQRAFESSEDG